MSTLFLKDFSVVTATQDTSIIDDNQTNQKLKHYFTYSLDTDKSVYNGWSQSDASFGSDELKTQHWVWNEDNNEASKHWYSFTFEGTGFELVGITPTGSSKNTFTVDGQTPVEVTIDTSTGAKESTLFTQKDLPFGTHTVTVTLPNDNNQTGLQISYAKVFGAKESSFVTDKILPSDIDGSQNKFIYHDTASKEWSINDDEAYLSLGNNATEVEDAYYDVAFVGNTIKIFANKSHNHGMIKFTVDGNYEQIVDLYNSTRTKPTLVYEASGLSEGAHILKAQLLDTKSGSSFVNQVAYAQVIHEKYVVTDIVLDNENLSLVEGAEYQIKYSVVPDYATLDTVTYSSSDESVATLSSKGIIKALAIGTTKITIEAENITKEILVTVNEAILQLGGTIVDSYTQYTQDRYKEVITQGLTSMKLNAWQNDTAVSEISLFTKDCILSNVTIEVSDLIYGDKVISKDNVETTFIKSNKAYNGPYLGYGSKTRKVPEDDGINRSESNDILYQNNPIEIGFNKLQNAWIEFNIPKGTDEGIYEGTLQVSANGLTEPLIFTYNLEVMDVELADTTDFKNSFDIELWQYPYSSAEYYQVEPFSSEHLALLKPIMEKYKEVGGSAITTTILEEAWDGQTYSDNEVHYPSMVKWTKNNDGSFSYDYQHFDQWVQLNKALGIGDKIVLYSIAPWHNSFTYWQNDKLQYEPYSVGSARYRQVWSDFLQNLVNHLTEKGWFEESYLGIDERGFSSKAFDLIETIKNKDGKTLKTAGALGAIHDDLDLALRVTDLNVGDNIPYDTPEQYQELLALRNELGLRTTLYSCTEHQPGNFSLSAPVESYWSIINAGKHNTTGLLRWAYDAWVEYPLSDTTHNAFEPGDCFLVYPGDSKEEPMVRSSVRLEKMVEGLRDINKLIMIEKEYPQLKGKIDRLYDIITIPSKITQSYLSSEKVQQLSNEATTFKQGIVDITNQYLELRKQDQNKTGLKIAIDMATMVSKEELNAVVPVVVKEFKAVLANAETIYAKADATQKEINDAFDRLAKAMQMLSFIKGDKTALEKLVLEIEGLNSSNYIESSWQTMLLVKEKAKIVLADENAMIEEVSATYETLVRAYLDLRLKPNKDLLEDLINQTNGLNAANYTVESWKRVQTLLGNAKGVLANPEASQEEVDEAAAKLDIGIKELQTESVSKPIISDKATVNNKAKAVATGDDVSIIATMALLLLVLGTRFTVKKIFNYNPDL